MIEKNDLFLLIIRLCVSICSVTTNMENINLLCEHRLSRDTFGKGLGNRKDIRFSAAKFPLLTTPSFYHYVVRKHDLENASKYFNNNTNVTEYT